MQADEQARLNEISMTANEAALALGVSLRTFYRYVRLGEVPAVQVGGRIRVPRERFQQWLEDRAMANVSQPAQN